MLKGERQDQPFSALHLDPQADLGEQQVSSLSSLEPFSGRTWELDAKRVGWEPRLQGSSHRVPSSRRLFIFFL